MNSRTKGKVGEREARDVMRSLGFTDCIRSAQASGKHDADLLNTGNLHVESKRVARIAVEKFMDQAVRDAKPGTVPTVLMRGNRGDWLVMVRASDARAFATALPSASACSPAQSRATDPRLPA